MKNAKPKQNLALPKKRPPSAPSPHRPLRVPDVETEWGPVHVVERIVERFLKNFWPYNGEASLPSSKGGFRYDVSIQKKVQEISSCISNAKEGDAIYVDGPKGGTTYHSPNPGEPDFSALPRRVFAADRWARTVAKIVPKPGPGRKRSTERELTSEEKEQAVEHMHAFYSAINGQDVEAIERAGSIVPNFCLDQLTAALGLPRPLVFSVPIIMGGKTVVSVPVRLHSEEAPGEYRKAWVDASQMLRRIGFDSPFVKSFEKAAIRAELEAFCDGHHPGSREDVREVWAALWSDISLFLHQRGLPVSNVIAAHVALSLWERHGFPRPMTSRLKLGNTKTPTIGGLRQMFGRFAAEYAPDAEHLLRIVEEEKARHAEVQTAAYVKKKKQRR